MASCRKTLRILLLYLACSPLVTAGSLSRRRHGHHRHNHVGIARRLPEDGTEVPLRPRNESLPTLISDGGSEVTISRAFLEQLQQDLACLQGAVMSFLSPSTSSNPSTTATEVAPTSAMVPTVSLDSTRTSTSTTGVPDQLSPTLSSPDRDAYNFNPQSSSNLAVYYAQTAATDQVHLDTLCQDPSVDIVILAFVNHYFAGGGYPALNFGAACGGQSHAMVQNASGLLQCTDLAQRILSCQTMGKKIFISLGGAKDYSTSTFTSDNQAIKFAETLWNLFGEGTGDNPELRPFGNVTVDGFDIDNEDGSTAYYDTFIISLRSKFPSFDPHYLESPSDPSLPKRYYISTAPQCPRPDASIPLAGIQSADFVFVQFYNNPDCDIDAPGFDDSFKAWSEDLINGTGLGVPRLYIGAPAFAAGGRGYMSAKNFSNVIRRVKGMSAGNFGGVMLWDGSEAIENVDSESKNYIEGITSALKT